MKKLNNKGFTLVEVLAVVVILVAIMSIAIPNISSSIERSRNKQEEASKKVIISASELYVSKYRGKISSNNCSIKIESLVSEGYLSEEDIGKYKNQYVIYNNAEYNISESVSVNACVEDGDED